MNLEQARKELQQLWLSRHYYPEQGFDTVYLDALKKLKQAEAEYHQERAQHHAKTAQIIMEELEEM